MMEGGCKWLSNVSNGRLWC